MPDNPERRGEVSILSGANLKRGASVACLLGLLFLVAYYMQGFDLLLTPKAQLRDIDGNPLEVISLASASQLCLAQLDNRYRSTLLSRHIDDHSSRFDTPRNVFLVFMYASVGRPGDSTLTRIHCHVRPGDTTVSYFGIFKTS